MTINTKQLFNLKSTALPWLILGAVYLLLNVMVIGMARWEFQYGILYSLGFLGIAFVLAETKATLIPGLAVAVLGVAIVFVEMDQIPIMTGLILGAISFAAILAAGFGVLNWKTKGDFKYLVLVPFFLIIGWAFLYFYQRMINLELPLNLPTILNHGGVAILCFDGILQVSGAYKKQWLTMIGLGAAVIGAFWLTQILGWGLALVPP